MSAFSLMRSPATPRDYAQTAAMLAGPKPGRNGHGPAEDEAPPAIALADHGLHSAVRMAVACREAGIEHICGLRVRVAPERGYRVWDERVGELVLLAMDEQGWLNLIALTNLGHVAGWSPIGPRVDWRDLAAHSAGLICLTGPPGTGMLTPYAERATDGSAGPAAEVAAALADVYPGRLYVELAYHGHALDKLVNRALVGVAERLDLPVVATNAVRFATPRQSLAATVLGSIAQGRRMRGLVTNPGRTDVPTITLDAARAQAYLKSAKAMRVLFSGLPAALEATEEIARRCAFRLPLVEPGRALLYGPRYFTGAAPAREDDRLAALARDGLVDRYHDAGERPGPDADARLDHELRLIGEQGIAGLLLAAHDVAQYCRERGVGLAARGSATCSLVCWALGLVELNPLEHGLDADTFVYPGRPDPPDVDLEVAAPYAEAVREHVLRRAGGGLEPTGLPKAPALRLGISVSMGARQAVRDVGAAIGLEPSRVNALARLVPVLSSPGAIEEVVARTPELGTGGLSPNAEPYNTVVTVAGALESLPRRYGAHPTGVYLAPRDGPGVLSWLPAQWVGGDQLPDRFRAVPRFPALGGPPADEPTQLAHPVAGAVALEAPEAETTDDAPDGEFTAPSALNDRPALVSQWDRKDFEALGLTKLDLSPSTALLGESVPVEGDPLDAQLGAWRLIAAGETLCVPHLETIGVRMLLKRAAEAHRDHGAGGLAVESVEGLAQLLALWRPGAYASEREQAYLAVRYGRERPVYPHPAMAAVLDPTHGQVVYEEQLAALARLVGVGRAWAEQHRKAIADGQAQARFALEKQLREAATGAGWSADQVVALLVALGDHGGYLFRHGHALAQAHNALRQACRKVDRRARPRFYADVLNEGGSAAYGLGTAVEEARKAQVRILPPCVNRSADRFVVEDGDAVRVPLAAIRGVSGRAAQHILAARGAFGEFESLLDMLRKTDRRIVTRQDLLVLIKLGGLGFTGMSRAQLTIAHEYYLAAVDLMRATDRDPRQITAVPEDATAGMAQFIDADEWPPEILAAYDLAHLGFYVSAPIETERHADVLARHGVVSVAELGDHPDRADAAAGALITALRVRMTKKGEPMAWMTIADGTGAIECAVFPQSYARCAAVLREGAFVVARGRMAHEETGPRLFVDEVEALGGTGARVGALAVSVDERRRPRSA